MKRLPARTTALTREAVVTLPRTTVLVTAAYLLLYLVAIQQLVLSPGRRTVGPAIQVVDGWASRMFEPIAPFSFEPVAAFRPAPWLTLFVSPLNIAMGLALGALVAANVAVGVLLFRRARACRAGSFAGVLGALPAFLTGFACCAPTIAIVVGAQFTVALLAVRSYLLPLAVALLLASLALNTHREQRLTVESAASQRRGRVGRSVATPPR